MSKRVLFPIIGSIAIVLLLVPASSFTVRPAAESLSARITDQEFWRLVSDFSEPNGFFRSDNLLSNELWFQYVIPDLEDCESGTRVSGSRPGTKLHIHHRVETQDGFHL